MTSVRKRPTLQWTGALVVAMAAFIACNASQAVTVGSGTPASCTQAALQDGVNTGGEITFDCGVDPATIPISGMTIFATKALTIDGQGQITLDGGDVNQILQIYGSPGPLSTVTLRNLTFSKGRNSTGLNAGGAIINSGVLVLDNVTFIKNSAPFGGAILNQRCGDCAAASLTVRNSTFVDNTANAGGAINVQSDALVLTETRFINNTADTAGAIELYANADYTVNATIARNTFQGNVATRFGGGAIYAYPLGPGGTATISNNTFVGNRAEGAENPRGGALYLNNPTSLSFNTIVDNTAATGGGILFDSPTITLGNSIIANNTGGNCAGTAFTLVGNNLQFGDSTCAGVPVQDPKLGTLADNGGATQTIALNEGSPARDAASGECPPVDQRGATRPAPPQCDLGAYEASADETYLVMQGLFWAWPPGSEAGWGINFTHQGNVIFATWFTYGADGSPIWFIALLQRTSDNVYSGTVSFVLGPPFDSDPFPPNMTNEIPVGVMTIVGIDRDNAIMSWNVLGMRQTKLLTRQLFAAPVPICTWPSPIALELATNFQDMWWAFPAGSQSGWGINFTHQGNVIFATWFTYDSGFLPRWFILQLDRTAPNVYSGPVSSVVGSPFTAIPFDTGKVVETVVGSATVTIIDGNHATFAYTVKGVTQTKQLTRQVFVEPGTVCQ